MTTFNVGDEVTIDVDKAAELSLQLRNAIRDKIGVIKHIETTLTADNNSLWHTYTIAFDKIHIQLLSDSVIRLAQQPPLTVAETQQRKEKLALDLLALIEAYEKTTNTHIASINLRIHTYYGNVTLDRVVGVTLEVQL